MKLESGWSYKLNSIPGHTDLDLYWSVSSVMLCLRSRVLALAGGSK